MSAQYFYHTARGVAVLNRGDDKPLKRIGKFKTEAKAVEACKAHYEKACRALENLGREKPQAFFL